MGILASYLHFLSRENKAHPIKGDILTLGQQSVHTTLTNAKKIISSYGIVNNLPANLDTSTKIPEWKGTKKGNFTNAQTIFTLLGAKNVFVADYSTYEHPDYVFDLNYPVGEELREKFDVIFDAGTLEHVFDVPTALANLNFMLKKGGEIIVVSPSSNAIDHGFYSFSPTLFFDYFSEMGYHNFNCYLREAEPFDVNYKGNTYQYNKVGDQMVLLSPHLMEVHFYATKGKTDPGVFKKPIQTLYKKVYDNEASKENTNLARLKLVRPLYQLVQSVVPGFIKNYLQKRRSLRNNLSYIGKY